MHSWDDELSPEEAKYYVYKDEENSDEWLG